jgi:uncharacterized membrane protein
VFVVLGPAQHLAAKIFVDAQLIGQVWVPCALHLAVTTAFVALQWISGCSPQRRKLHGVRSVERHGEQSVNVFLAFGELFLCFLNVRHVTYKVLRRKRAVTKQLLQHLYLLEPMPFRTCSRCQS